MAWTTTMAWTPTITFPQHTAYGKNGITCIARTGFGGGGGVMWEKNYYHLQYISKHQINH
jgi:hypothetical protein